MMKRLQLFKDPRPTPPPLPFQRLCIRIQLQYPALQMASFSFLLARCLSLQTFEWRRLCDFETARGDSRNSSEFSYSSGSVRTKTKHMEVKAVLQPSIWIFRLRRGSESRLEHPLRRGLGGRSWFWIGIPCALLSPSDINNRLSAFCFFSPSFGKP